MLRCADRAEGKLCAVSGPDRSLLGSQMLSGSPACCSRMYRKSRVLAELIPCLLDGPAGHVSLQQPRTCFDALSAAGALVVVRERAGLFLIAPPQKQAPCLEELNSRAPPSVV